MDNRFLRHKVCITGGMGGLGRKLVSRLVTLGVQDIVVFDLPDKLTDRNEQSPSVVYRSGSILKETDLLPALDQCTIVYHLAALTHVGLSKEEPLRYVQVNGLGTASVLDACRKSGVKHFIYTSTGYVYGRPTFLPVDEGHPVAPLSVYAASKLAGETVVRGFAASYNFTATVARLSNLYGAKRDSETVIGKALEQVMAKKPVHLFNLSAVRDFIHADDAVEALIRIAGIEEPGLRTVNVSSNKAVTIGEMADILVAVAERKGFGKYPVSTHEDQSEEPIPALVLDNTCLRKLTGWTPQLSLEDGIERTLGEIKKGR